MLALSLFCTLAIGIMPAYLIAKPQRQIAKEKEHSNGDYIRECSRDLQGN
jgi:hypothetical protein